jgi:hypothetical protein
MSLTWTGWACKENRDKNEKGKNIMALRERECESMD